jgi:hypothetical protein
MRQMSIFFKAGHKYGDFKFFVPQLISLRYICGKQYCTSMYKIRQCNLLRPNLKSLAGG